MLAAKRAHEGGGDAAASSSRGSADVEIPMLPLSRHATANDSASDEAPVCRICASEALPGQPLVSPCNCTGTMTGVHESCLQHWIETRPSTTDEMALKCELCNAPYQVSWQRKFVCDCKHTCSCTACGHLSEFCVLLFCLVCILSLLFLLQPELKQSSTSERVFLLGMFGLTAVFSLFVLFKVFRRWRNASSATMLIANERLPNATGSTTDYVGGRMPHGQRGGADSNDERLPTAFAVTVIANMY